MAINVSFLNEPSRIEFYALRTGKWFTSPEIPNVVFLKTSDTALEDAEDNAIGFKDGCEFGEYYSFDGDDKISTEVKFKMCVGDAE